MIDNAKAADAIMAKLARDRATADVAQPTLRYHVLMALNAFALLALVSPRAAELAWDHIGTELEKAHDPA